jgi:hypothetical protein
MAVYTGGAYIAYSELYDRKPGASEVAGLLHGLSRLHTILLMSRVNAHLRHAMQSPGRDELNWVQGFLVRNFVDDPTLVCLRKRFPGTEMRDRPAFHPLQALSMLRLAAGNCADDEQQRPDENSALRFQLGTACLMMNDLLVSEQEELAIAKGTPDEREVQLMAQLLTMWEVMNPANAHHLLLRSHVLFRALLKDEEICADIRARCRGFDIEARFRGIAEIDLNKWLSLVFASYAYYMGRRKEELLEQPQLFVINRRAFIVQSAVTQDEMDAFLGTVSVPFADLVASFNKERPVDPRFDFVPFRSHPLYVVAEGNFACIDVAFLLEKMYSGVHWLIHDGLPKRDRDDLFKAWGLLFERYVHWLFNGGRLPAAYFPFPQWEDGQESFDGAFLKESLLIPLEYKGGFLSQEAKYSARSEALTYELERKIVPGCDQLASKIGALFNSDSSKRKKVPAIPVQHVSRVLPVLIVQDHALRGLSINWWLNRRFRELMNARPLRDGVEVLPLNVVNIEDLETLVESSDGGVFDFIYSLHNKAVRDPEMKQQLHNYLLGAPGYGSLDGARWKEIDGQIRSAMFSYTFPS